MNAFIQKYDPHVKGVLSGFDRLVFQGTLRWLAIAKGMMDFLWHAQVLLKDFGAYAQGVTERVKAASLEEANRKNRPVSYLPSSRTSKEEAARRIAQADGISEGLIGVLQCVEPIMSYSICRDRAKKKLILQSRLRRGLQFYHYWMDPDFGFMHGRIATWFPFQIQVCVNGREWLARQMDRVGLQYRREDNCFTWLEDVQEAQRLMDQMLRVTWPDSLRAVAHRLNPAHDEILGVYPVDYYWTVFQSEWATDVMFDRRASVEQMYPLLTRGVMEAFSSDMVMRFLGKKPSPNYLGEVYTDHRRRQEGVRVKHQMRHNAIKAYDKGSVFRVETTINDPTDFKSYRTSERDPNGEKKWHDMRRGIADLHRRAEVSHACNERYLDALATLNTDKTLHHWVAPVCRPSHYKGQRVRALRPWSEPDRSLLQAVNDGAFCINGFRNRDLVDRFHPKGFSNQGERRRASAQITRQIRLLRAHGILRKVPHTYRYQVTDQGRKILTAILQYQSLTLEHISRAAG